MDVPDKMKAFNAALVIFGCLFISQSANNLISSDLIPNDAAKSALGKAINALDLLDGNNHLVERCRHYLQQLDYVLRSSSTFPAKVSSVKSGYILIRHAVPRPSNADMAEGDQIYTNSQQQFDIANFDFVEDPNWAMQSAFDINMGEFMLDTDMQFLNNYFRKDGLAPNAPTLAPG